MCTILDLSVMSKFLHYYCFMALVLCYTAVKFHCYLCLRVKFHKLSLWVPILTAEGPYWVPISQNSWIPISKLGLVSGTVLSRFRHRSDKCIGFTPVLRAVPSPYEDASHSALLSVWQATNGLPMKRNRDFSDSRL